VPSARHEGLLSLFRSRPDFALELLAVVAPPPAVRGPVAVVEGSRTEIRPVERRADLVVTVGQPRPELVIAVEVQLRRDRAKPRRWALYAAMLGDRHDCPVEVLVVTPSSDVARWASEGWELSPRRRWWPRVVGPESLPRLDAAGARAAPELAVLSAIAHADRADAAEAVVRAMEAVATSDWIQPDQRLVYHDLMMAALPEAVERELREMVARGKYEWQSRFAREHIALGRQEGREEGRVEGRELGRNGRGRELLRAALERRGHVLDAVTLGGIEAADAERLEAWLLALVDGEDAGRVIEAIGSPPSGA
jgi:Arc/MetJ-type ribon-helix-helix transcriptional regulator